jgi:puromycin-sensitive aminopeptidase
LNTASLLLTIQYRGFLNNQMAGFYRSTYLDIDGNPKIMASTQFEALDARRAFPCWDEPSRKAVFGVTLVIPDHMMGLSNMPEISRKSLPSMNTTTTGIVDKNQRQRRLELTFADTPLMSTYLLAFCVGEFDFLQATTQHGVSIKVFTPPGKAESGRFALDCAVRALDQYDDFFHLPYPLPKLDMVAIPEVS